jgi:AcrR family transcriptional regulator
LSLRPLAAALGTSDRTLLYYFGSGEHLLEKVLDSVGDGLVAALSEAVPVGRSHPEVLLRAVWSAARNPGVEPVLRLYVEILGQAAAKAAPFPAVTRRVAGHWLAWAQDRVDVPVAKQQDAGRRPTRDCRRPARPELRRFKQRRRSGRATTAALKRRWRDHRQRMRPNPRGRRQTEQTALTGRPSADAARTE